jgi:hypothetical protein
MPANRCVGCYDAIEPAYKDVFRTSDLIRMIEAIRRTFGMFSRIVLALFLEA